MSRPRLRRSDRPPNPSASTVNGWNIGAAAGVREFYHGNWALRAAAAKLGIYGNSEAEAVYPFTRSDVNSITLDGSKHTYLMTFPAGQLPPVNAFWSITMYDGAHPASDREPDQPLSHQLADAAAVEEKPRRLADDLHPEGLARQGQGVQLAACAGRPDVHRHAPLLAEDGAALGVSRWARATGSRPASCRWAT